MIELNLYLKNSKFKKISRKHIFLIYRYSNAGEHKDRMIIDCANDLLSNNISTQVTICQGILKYKTPYTSIPLTF